MISGVIGAEWTAFEFLRSLQCVDALHRKERRKMRYQKRYQRIKEMNAAKS